MGQHADDVIDGLLFGRGWCARPQAKRCQHCGQGGLIWLNDGRKWYLGYPDCTPHVCRATACLPTDFPSV